MGTALTNPLAFSVIIAPAAQPISELRWQLTGMAIGVILLAFALAGLAVFFMQRKTSDRSLLFFSLFSLLYAIRLIFRQKLAQSLVLTSPDFWKYFDLVIDCVIVVPLTLFLIEIAQATWKVILWWLLAFQITFETARFLSLALGVGQRPISTAHNIVIIIFCALLVLYPGSFPRQRRVSREFKALYAGLLIFGLFVIHSNLVDLRVIHGRSVEPLGFLALVCCLGYLAAVRTFANEEHLLAVQEELKIARRIQSSILPRDLPRIGGLDIAARYVPMTAVAGDFYDFLVMDEKHLGILVADVTGHGVPAALIASLLKTALASQSLHVADPARVLGGLNRSLCGKFEEHFVTAMYLFVDAERSILRYAGAGHPPLLVGCLNSGQRLAFSAMESNGLLLGISELAEYHTLERSFRPGDRCILYIDGALEAKNAAQEEFGASRFISFLETHSGLAAGPLLAAFLVELANWSGRAYGRAQEDDITLIAVDFERIPLRG